MQEKEKIVRALIAERIIATSFKRYLKEFLNERNLNLDFEMVFVLFTLSSLKGYGQKELANLFGYDPATMGRIIDRLVELKYITKVKDEIDARKNILALTEHGLGLIDEISIQAYKWYIECIVPNAKGMSPDDVGEALERIRGVARLLRKKKGDYNDEKW